MHPVRVDREAHLVVHPGGDGRLDPATTVVRPTAHVEQDLGAEPLHHLDHGIEGQSDESAPEPTRRSSGRMPSVTSLPVCAPTPFVHRRRHLDADAVADRQSAPFWLRCGPAAKFIAGEPIKPATKRLAGSL